MIGRQKMPPVLLPIGGLPQNSLFSNCGECLQTRVAVEDIDEIERVPQTRVSRIFVHIQNTGASACSGSDPTWRRHHFPARVSDQAETALFRALTARQTHSDLDYARSTALWLP